MNFRYHWEWRQNLLNVSFLYIWILTHFKGFCPLYCRGYSCFQMEPTNMGVCNMIRTRSYFHSLSLGYLPQPAHINNLWDKLFPPGLEIIYPSNAATFPTISYVFLYFKHHNFPPNCQISLEGASWFPHFFPPWFPHSQKMLKRLSLQNGGYSITGITSKIE